MDKIVIKKYGANSLGANPDWIEDVKFIPNDHPIPEGYYKGSRSEVSIFKRTQGQEKQDWLQSLKTPITRLTENRYKDYKQARTALKGLVSIKGWGNLTEREKEKACEWFVVSSDTIMEYYQSTGLSLQEAFDKKKEYAEVFNKKSQACRAVRFEKLYVYIRNIIPEDNLNALSTDLASFQFKDSYIVVGTEGSMKVNYQGANDDPGLFDYIQGTEVWTGLEYPTFASRVTIPLYGFTIDQVIDTCMDILDNGNY